MVEKTQADRSAIVDGGLTSEEPTPVGLQRHDGRYPQGTSVTIIHAPSSTKNQGQAYDLDITGLPKLLREGDRAIFADAGYTSDRDKKGSRRLGLSWRVNDKSKPGQNLSSNQHNRNRKYSPARARVEVIFRIIKC